MCENFKRNYNNGTAVDIQLNKMAKEEINRNRLMLKAIAKAIIFLMVNELPFRGDLDPSKIGPVGERGEGKFR